MKVTSLKKVTFFVFTCILGSHFAIANENGVTNELKTMKTEVSNTNKKASQFSLLIEKLDLDKNGLLSKEEIQVSKNNKLLNHFTDIDLNTDSTISESEFNQYITKVK